MHDKKSCPLIDVLCSSFKMTGNECAELESNEKLLHSKKYYK